MGGSFIFAATLLLVTAAAIAVPDDAVEQRVLGASSETSHHSSKIGDMLLSRLLIDDAAAAPAYGPGYGPGYGGYGGYGGNPKGGKPKGRMLGDSSWLSTLLNNKFFNHGADSNNNGAADWENWGVNAGSGDHAELLKRLLLDSAAAAAPMYGPNYGPGYPGYGGGPSYGGNHTNMPPGPNAGNNTNITINKPPGSTVNLGLGRHLMQAVQERARATAEVEGRFSSIVRKLRMKAVDASAATANAGRQLTSDASMGSRVRVAEAVVPQEANKQQ